MIMVMPDERAMVMIFVAPPPERVLRVEIGGEPVSNDRLLVNGLEVDEDGRLVGRRSPLSASQ
jgi:hypothetical protein